MLKITDGLQGFAVLGSWTTKHTKENCQTSDEPQGQI